MLVGNLQEGGVSRIKELARAKIERVFHLQSGRTREFWCLN